MLKAAGTMFVEYSTEYADMSQQIESSSHQMQLNEDLELHRKGWLVQRFGWVLMYALVAAAAFGFFGDGVASKSSAMFNEGVIEYDRYYRYDARMELLFKVNSSTANPVIAFSNEYLSHFKIESIVPEPAANSTSGGMIHYTFQGQAPMQITFYLVPQKAGKIEGTTSINGEQQHLSHFIYP